MARPTTLVTMFNIAAWGGLHENVWYSCTGLAARGWDVTVACRAGQLVDRLRADGIGVHVVENWQDTVRDADELGRRRWDVVHSHPFLSRELALEVARRAGAPLVATFHGNYDDKLASWRQHASALVAVSRAHAAMLASIEGFDVDRVVVLPNAVRDVVLEEPAPSAATKLAGAAVRVVVASRLDRDKRSLLDCVEAVTDVARDTPGRPWVVEVLGDGGHRGDLSTFLDEQAAKAPHLQLQFEGWVDSEEVPRRLRSATFAVASGRGAAQALAVGTPVVAFGSQGVYGLQHGSNLDNGLWGNFGGFPLTERASTDLRSDLARLLGDEDFYGRVQAAGRIAVRAQLLQSDCDDRLDTLLRRVAGVNAALGPRRGWRRGRG